VANKDTIVALGSMRSLSVLVVALGLLITGWLMAKKVRGGLLIGMLATTVISMIAGTSPLPTGLSSIISFTNPFTAVAPTFMQLNVKAAFDYGLISILFAFTFVDLFDNIGTLMGISRKAGLLDEQGNLPRIGKALLADSIGTMFGAVMGTPTVTSYIESTAGVSEGGRSGLTAVTVAILFVIAIVFAPLVGLIPSIATAPVLILVGVLMMGEVVHINFQDITDAIPAFLSIIMMPLTYSIAQGLAFGFMSYCLIKLVTGRWKENNAVIYILTVLFILHFVIG
jgi:AGZA family xanthine/uracil permease-like MFS transporter